MFNLQKRSLHYAKLASSGNRELRICSSREGVRNHPASPYLGTARYSQCARRDRSEREVTEFATKHPSCSASYPNLTRWLMSSWGASHLGMLQQYPISREPNYRVCALPALETGTANRGEDLRSNEQRSCPVAGCLDTCQDSNLPPFYNQAQSTPSSLTHDYRLHDALPLHWQKQ